MLSVEMARRKSFSCRVVIFHFIMQTNKKHSKHLFNNSSLSRSDRETYIKAKYVQHKYVELDTFLRTCNRLDGSIIKNLARIKVYHDQKHSGKLERSDSTVGKILHGLKQSFKGERPERMRSGSTDVTSDVSTSGGSGGGDSPKMTTRKRSDSKTNVDKKHKGINKLKHFRAKKDNDSKSNRKKSLESGLEVDSNELTSDSFQPPASSDDGALLSTSPPSERTSDTEAIDYDGNHDEDQKDQELISGSPEPPIATGDGSLSEDFHPADSDLGIVSPRTFAAKVFDEHSPDKQSEAKIIKTDSTDSVLSDGAGSGSSGVKSDDDKSEDASFRDDLEKAIEVLKILHPNRVSIYNNCK